MLETYYDKVTVAPLCQSFRSKGYVHGHTDEQTNEDLRVLANIPPFLRTLIVTDGTVTKSLEAFYWESVAVDLLGQGIVRSDHALHWLDVAAGEEVITRDVHLRGETSDRVFAGAFSIIRPAAIPAELTQKLLDGVIGVGELIRNSGLETYRELLEFGTERRQAYAFAADRHRPALMEVAFRSYRIITHGEPAIMIRETFPMAVYRQAS